MPAELPPPRPPNERPVGPECPPVSPFPRCEPPLTPSAARDRFLRNWARRVSAMRLGSCGRSMPGRSDSARGPGPRQPWKTTQYVVAGRPGPHEVEKVMCDTKLIDEEESYRRELRSMRLRVWLTATSGIVIRIVTALLLLI